VTKILDITNGDSAVELMKQAGVAGEFLPWRDFLLEGPVRYGNTLEQLSSIRANYIVQQGGVMRWQCEVILLNVTTS